MYLGPSSPTLDGPRHVHGAADEVPRVRALHGLGHAFMRGFHSYLRDAVTACNKLGTHFSPTALQGAFHDYCTGSLARWRRDRATGPGRRRPRVRVRRGTFKRPCWYRYFWEREASRRVYEAPDILGLCKDEQGMQRAGCVSGASLLVSRERDPVDHARVCTALQGVDTYNCLRGVNVPGLDGRTFEQLRLVRTAGDLPSATSAWCYRWFGRTLAVLTDGAFRMQGCAQLRDEAVVAQCARGSARTGLPSGRSPRPPAPATVALGDCHRR